MTIKWGGLELPTRVQCDRESMTPTFGRFVAEPFERGYGVTIGNSLRRILLSSIEGAAVTSVKIEGAAHEFTTLSGVVDDVTDIVLSVKRLLVKIHTNEARKIYLDVVQKGEITAAHIRPDPAVEILNPDLHLATVSEDVPFRMELTVKRGRGYETAEENSLKDGEPEIGVIHVDSIFSPVHKVSFRTENTRVGKLTEYDRLTIEVTTNGTVSPEQAVVEAGMILRKHMNPFVHYFELGHELIREEIKKEEDTSQIVYIRELREKLARPISELDLSVRASNCLEAENMRSVGDLVTRSEAEMLKIRNFGKTSLKEIKKELEEVGLSLGMQLPAGVWPPAEKTA